MQIDEKVFIEDQFPVSKISKESYKERKAGATQTLTGLGKWWGRKPLILIRASIIGMLMPISADPKKDREIFLKILTMDHEGLWLRCNKAISIKSIFESSSTSSKEKYFVVSNKGKISWNPEIEVNEKEIKIRSYFDNLSYDQKLLYCDRPEQIDGPSTCTWKEINAHLSTNAKNLKELIKELGTKRFGHVPRVGDPFCGGGSIPFEAARLGCEAYGSDLNPVGALLTWASINLIGGGKKIQNQVLESQQNAYRATDKQLTKWGIEHNSKGWRSDAFLYCVETICPSSGLMLPLAPTWVISEKYRVCAVLKRNESAKKYDIEIVTNADQETFNRAKIGTVKNSRLVCPETGESFPISSIRGDKKNNSGKTVHGLRLWENDDLVPRIEDVFQERLYCVRWIEKQKIDGKEKEIRHFCSVTEEDIDREEKVLKIMKEYFNEWQERGYIPKKNIESGYNTSQPIRERGWTHWHHLFNPRQLLMHGTFLKNYLELTDESPEYIVSACLSLGAGLDQQARLCGLNPHKSKGPGSTRNVFFNQALNTQYIYGLRPLSGLIKFYLLNLESHDYITNANVETRDARQTNTNCDFWITDPPYADAINYHELTDFFLSWYEKHLKRAFPTWYTDTKKELAVKGSGKGFKESMVEIYSSLTKQMPDNGLQMVQFTHQDPSVWADLGMILWASRLKVTAAWTIGTETMIGLKKGNYVQGTVLLILRKRLSSETAFLDELYPEIEDEVREQLDHMIRLDNKEEPNFGDTDYQLAAYAAALKVLTRYSEIEGKDIRHELFRERQRSEKSEFEKVIDRAVEIACDHLVPDGFDEFQWKGLSNNERLYLKGLELEKHLEARSGAYQELAKGFGVHKYTPLYAKSKANEVRFKTASEFKKSGLDGEGFSGSLVRNLLFAIHETVKKEDAKEGLMWLKTEIPDYWNRRKLIISILKYLSRLSHIPHMPHWQLDADGALRLSGAVENDHVGNI
jgi:putative DNA methylase